MEQLRELYVLIPETQHNYSSDRSLDNIVLVRSVRKFPAFNVTRGLDSAFTRVRH